MKKLTLNLNELKVDTFSTDKADADRGTVEGASLPTRPLCTGYPACNTNWGCPETATCTLEVCC